MSIMSKEEIESIEIYSEQTKISGKIYTDDCYHALLVFEYENEEVRIPFRFVFNPERIKSVQADAEFRIENYVEEKEFERLVEGILNRE